MKSLIKNLLFALGLAILVWLGYTVFFSEDAITLDEQSQSAALVEEQVFLGKLKELQGLDLNTDLFSDEEFLSLVDHTVQVVDEEAGRPNPFAPVPGLILVPPQQQQASQR